MFLQLEVEVITLSNNANNLKIIFFWLYGKKSEPAKKGICNCFIYWKSWACCTKIEIKFAVIDWHMHLYQSKLTKQLMSVSEVCVCVCVCVKGLKCIYNHKIIISRKSSGWILILSAWHVVMLWIHHIEDVWEIIESVTAFRKEGNVLFNDALNTFYLRLYGVRHVVKDHWDSERGNPLPPHGLLFPISSNGSFICIKRNVFYLTTHSTHFIYGYMASDIWLRTILIVRKETRCRHIGYSYRLTARVLLYAPSHIQDNTYHGLCYTSRGALAGTRNSSMGPPHEGSIRRPIAPWANALPLNYVPLLYMHHSTDRIIHTTAFVTSVVEHWLERDNSDQCNVWP